MTRGSRDSVGKLRAEATRLNGLDPFQVLAIPVESDASAIRAAYLAATKRFHPNLFARESVELRDAATEVFLLVRRAYTQLEDEARRRQWRERLQSSGPGARTPSPEPPPIAAPATSPVAAPAAAPEPPRPPAPTTFAPRPVARAESTSLTGRSPDEVRALLEEARTRGQRFEQAGRLITEADYAEARALMQKLAAEDPQNRKYRVRLYLATGLEHLGAERLDDAVRELERATALEPDNVEVARALIRARERKDARGGIFSKLFGR